MDSDPENDCLKQYEVVLPDELSKFKVTRDKIIEFELKDLPTIIYVPTRKIADMLLDSLVDRNFYASTIYDGLSQQDRNKIVNKFNQGFIQILITTEPYADGVDITLVNRVVNYHVPLLPDSEEPDISVYAQRLCCNGAVFNLVCGMKEKMNLEKIMTHLNQPIIKVPSWTSFEQFMFELNTARLK